MNSSSSKTFFLLLFYFWVTSLSAQKWDTTPQKCLVFEISNDEAEKLLIKPHKIKVYESLLYNQVDTFDVEKGWIKRPEKGHFVLARVVDSELICEYQCVFPFQVFLLSEYNSMTIQVVDSVGKVRTDAKVKLRRKRLWADPDTKAYRLESTWFRGKDRRLTVELEGFRAILNVTKYKYDDPWRNDSYNEPPSFYSYMITDKNKYRPGDSIRFKSYALSQSRWPLRKKLELYLNSWGRRIKIADVKHHRPGGYAGGFILHDSLDLRLDRNYSLQLYTKDSRLVASTRFSYEDYELVGDKLQISLTNNQHYFPKTNQLKIQAMDENGLLLKDAEAEISVRIRSVSGMYQSFKSYKNLVLHKKMKLSPTEATTIDIPANLFGKANLIYDIKVKVINVQNQVLERNLLTNYFYSQYRIASVFRNDSIRFSFIDNNKTETNIKAMCWVDGRSRKDSVSLPATFKINPSIASYRFKNNKIDQTISIGDLWSELTLEGGFETDSFKLSVRNPQNLDLTWFIYRGEELIDKGIDTVINHSSFIDTRYYTYYADIFYTLGGKDHKLSREFVFKKKHLNVTLDMPDRVFPGQEVDATIRVRNDEGRPVRGVDLTALATTSRLNYYLPSLPYYGDFSVSRDRSDDFNMHRFNTRVQKLPLNYKKWAKRFNLENILYYQLIFPQGKEFKHSYGISDSTQFAPYIVDKGKAKTIYVIEVDRKPIYFSWTDRPKEYSFYIDPNKKHILSLRLFDRTIVFDSMQFERGKKTILSFDLNNLPTSCRTYKFHTDKYYRSYLARAEIGRFKQYVGRYNNMNFKFGYFENDHIKLPLFDYRNSYSPSYRDFSFGPIPSGKITFHANDSYQTTFRFEGDFAYAFEDNVVYKLNSNSLVPSSFSIKLYSPLKSLEDLVLNKKDFLAGALQKKMQVKRWKQRIIDIERSDNRLKAFLPHEQEASGVRALILQDSKSGELSVPFHPYFWHPERITTGQKNCILLYNNGNYLKIDNVDLQENGYSVVDMQQLKLQPRDSISVKWLVKYPFKYETVGKRRIQRNARVKWSLNETGNITGTITDEDGEPMPGVTIIEKGTSNGTITDFDGQFSLYISGYQTTITTSFIGYISEEIEVTIGTNIQIELERDDVSLDEVIVVAYGISRRSHLTGSVTGVAIRDLNESKTTQIKKQQLDEKQEAEKELYQALKNLHHLRSNFNDVGFWKPKLYTNRKGESKFKVKFPDDITRWDAVVYAMNRRLQTGTVRKSIKSYKPLMAELHLPRFLTKGDSANFIGNVSNYTQDSLIRGTVKRDGAGKTEEMPVSFTQFRKDLLPVYASNTDSIKMSYSFTRDDSYFDGEQRTIPVIQQGTVRANGSLNILAKGDSQEIKAEVNEEIQVEMMTTPLELYQHSAKNLIKYKYACNEQLASKLIGLISYKQIQKIKVKRFRHERHIKKIIKRLLKNQNDELLWSWWNRNKHSSSWMSAHILNALNWAKKEGYRVNLDTTRMQQNFRYQFEVLHKANLLDLSLLESLAEFNMDLNYKEALTSIETQIDTLEINQQKRHLEECIADDYCRCRSFMYEKFQVLNIKKMVGLKYDTQVLLDHKEENILGGVYFKDSIRSRFWYNDGLTSNLLAYRIIDNDSSLSHLKAPLQLYIINSQKTHYWNTFRRSNILRTLLPDALESGFSEKKPTTVYVSGKTTGEIVDFPKEIILKPNENLKIEHQKGLPLLLMAYKKERVTKAATGVEGFKIKTYFDNYSNQLRAGQKVRLKVEVDVIKKNNQKHIMIEVPIPASCSYGAKKQYRYWSHETHREYFKEKTVIFCENLPKGKHLFNIELLPRFTGKYIINPAQVSLMYLPVINANTDMKKVSVEEKL